MNRISIDAYGISEAGRVRRVNEDQFLVARLTRSMHVERTSIRTEDRSWRTGAVEGYLFLVADGVAGAPAGERASEIAVRFAVRHVLDTLPWFPRFRDGDLEVTEDLSRAFREAQARIDAFVEEHPSVRGMATTLTMACVLWPRLYVVHVGDSRCYLLRGSGLEQVTHDHTVAQALADRGLVRAQGPSRWSRLLWNAIGGDSSDLRPEVYRGWLAEGDVLLLATDGLTRRVPEALMAKALRESPGAEEACRKLVAAAAEMDGTDNTSVVVARFRPPREEGAGGP